MYRFQLEKNSFELAVYLYEEDIEFILSFIKDPY